MERVRWPDGFVCPECGSGGRKNRCQLWLPSSVETLKRLQAVEHTWENKALVVQATRPQPDVERLLDALGIRLPSSDPPALFGHPHHQRVHRRLTSRPP